MSVPARSHSTAGRHPAANLGATSLAFGFLALLLVAPLSAQNAKNLMDLLANPQVQDMPPLVRAASDGAMLAGKLIVPPIPRVTLTAHRGEKIAPADPQRLAAASPDILYLARIEAMRLPPHFLTTENAADRAVLKAVFADKIPAYFQNIEPAANAPRVDFVKPGALTASFTEDVPPAAPASQTVQTSAQLPLLAALAGPDSLTLPDAFLTLPPPPVRLVAVKPQALPVAKPDLTVLTAVVPGASLAAVKPPKIIPVVPGPSLAAVEPPRIATVVPGPSLAAVEPPTIKGELVPPPTPEVTALINAVPVPVAPTEDPVPALPVLTGTELDKALQEQLKVLNCYSGSLDGAFGPGSQGALDLFFQTSGLKPVSQDRTAAVLDQLTALTGKVCDKPYRAAKKPDTTVASGDPPPKPAKPAKPTKPAVPKPTVAKQDPPKKKTDDTVFFQGN